MIRLMIPMSIDDKIPSGLMKEKLKHLDYYIKGRNEIIYDFAKHFAQRLPHKVSPMEYVIAFDVSIEDSKKGRDSGNKRKIYGSQVKLSQDIYTLLDMYIPCFAEITCPPDFAKRVKEIVDY